MSYILIGIGIMVLAFFGAIFFNAGTFYFEEMQKQKRNNEE